MEIQILHIDEYDRWERFIDKSPQQSIYVRTWYLDALDIQYKILVAVEKDSIKGGIILTKNELKLYGNPLFVKYLGICFDAFDGSAYTIETNNRKVLKAIIPHIQKYRTFDYTFHQSFRNHLSFYWGGFHQATQYTYLMPLAERSPEEILGNVNSRMRNKIKKAIADSNLTLDHDVDFDSFYAVNEKTFLRQGGKMPIKKDRLEKLICVLQEHNAVNLMGVRNEANELLCVLGLFHDDRTAYLILNGFDPDKIVTGSNELLVFSAIKLAISKSLTTFDFEGSMLRTIESFYRQFGAELTPYYNIWNPSIVQGLKNMLVKTYKKIKRGK